MSRRTLRQWWGHGRSPGFAPKPAKQYAPKPDPWADDAEHYARQNAVVAGRRAAKRERRRARLAVES